jgi:hypothetical protein
LDVAEVNRWDIKNFSYGPVGVDVENGIFNINGFKICKNGTKFKTLYKSNSLNKMELLKNI